MGDKFVIFKGNPFFFQGCPQPFHIGAQFLVSLYAGPEKISEISFFRKRQTEFRKRDLFQHLLDFLRIVIFPDECQSHMQIRRRNIISLHSLLFQIVHAGDQRLLHLRRK